MACEPNTLGNGAAFRVELSKLEVPAIRQRIVDNLAHVDEKLARRVADGVDSATLKPIREALEQAGAQCKVVSLRLGSVSSVSKRQIAGTPVVNLSDRAAALQIAHDFVAAIAKHRHWDRANIDAVPV